MFTLLLFPQNNHLGDTSEHPAGHPSYLWGLWIPGALGNFATPHPTTMASSLFTILAPPPSLANSLSEVLVRRLYNVPKVYCRTALCNDGYHRKLGRKTPANLI